LPRLLQDLIRFRRAALWGHAPLICPRLFVSHRKTDAARAREIAQLAQANGFQVWLDVLEPELNLPVGQPSTPEGASWVIATLIETALLNSTHVLAVMTPETDGSRWVPYEYGRVKDSSPNSLNAACWIDSRVHKKDLAEYLLLSPMTHTDAQIEQWLRAELAAWRAVYPACSSGADDTIADQSAPSVVADPPPLTRNEINERLDVFHTGLPFDIPAMPRITFKTRKPADQDNRLEAQEHDEL
jgi:hypothetical protein